MTSLHSQPSRRAVKGHAVPSLIIYPSSYNLSVLPSPVWGLGKAAAFLVRAVHWNWAYTGSFSTGRKEAK